MVIATQLLAKATPQTLSQTSLQTAPPGPLSLPAVEFCPRQISFTIPGKVGVLVTATEDAGKIDFVVDALSQEGFGKLALFFHFNKSKLGTLQITGGDGFITETKIQANNVIDLGQGVNMNGKADPFDIGIAFGTPGKGHDFVTDPVHFTLDAVQSLTLDDIAHVLFGARLTSVGDKITFLAPAAPKANDDFATTHEDTPKIINVLANDTDADGDHLTITDVHVLGDTHGTVAISTDGQSITYTPDEDYAGLNFNDSKRRCQLRILRLGWEWRSGFSDRQRAYHSGRR